jgi:enoyl-CoA hydratase/carnithine racemase
MGGGMGLYMGSSHKVVTPDSRLAMPEVTIGLYPDVGGTWFLNRLDMGIGMFLGMTGMMVTASDALALHLADHMALAEHKSVLLEQLQVADWDCVDDAYEVVTELLENFDVQSNAYRPELQIMPYFAQIEQACDADSAIQAAGNILAIPGDQPWLNTAKQNLATGSAITLHICYRQMQHFQQLSLADCFRLELNLSVRCGLLGEFREGVRARLIDKDGQPNWRYSSVADVDIEVIDQLFSSLWSESDHPLAQLGHY